MKKHELYPIHSVSSQKTYNKSPKQKTKFETLDGKTSTSCATDPPFSLTKTRKCFSVERRICSVDVVQVAQRKRLKKFRLSSGSHRLLTREKVGSLWLIIDFP